MNGKRCSNDLANDRAVRKRAVARDQGQAQLLAGHAKTKIDVAQLAAIVALVIGHDAELQYFPLR